MNCHQVAFNWSWAGVRQLATQMRPVSHWAEPRLLPMENDRWWQWPGMTTRLSFTWAPPEGWGHALSPFAICRLRF